MADPTHILRQLEQRLSALERSGVRWLSIARDPTLAPTPPQPGPSTAPEGRTAAAPRAEPADPPAQASATPAGRTPGRATPAMPEGAAEAPMETGPGERLRPADCATLTALHEAFHDCRHCKLCETRTHVVFGVGREAPRVMFIGEGPGADEDAQGEPFVGRAGRLLTGLIEAMGLVREDVYITNVVKCRPPGNRNPEPDEIAACRPILQRQIELLQPQLIVTLGNVPLKLLKPRAAGITRERGTPFTYERWTVLPTFHTSYLLRNPAAIEACWADFRKARRMAYPEV